MNVISSPRFIARHLAGADHTGAAAQPGAALLRLRSAQNDSSTRVTTGQSDDRRVVYDDWRSGGTASRAGHLWSSPIGRDDTVSALMARNRGLNSYQMSDQWRGLGGALLTQFGKTGAGFSQTMADDSNARLPDVVDSLQVLSPAEQAQRSVEILAMQQTDLAGVTQGAQTAALKIQTRSGQSVELKIAVNSGERGTVGMKVELEASAELSADERSTVAQLANGLDRALEGLGRDDALALDLAGLMGYDRGLISSIDLTASNPSTHQPLHTFALHLGDHEQTIALKGSDGELNVTVVAPPATGSATRKQQPSAMQQMLHRMDAAAQRGHAADALVQQMKSAFTAFQTAFAAAQGKDEDPDKLLTVSPPEVDATTAASGAAMASAPVRAKVADASSGLADFNVSFAGETHRSNRSGSHNEAGRAEYELSQKTTNADNGRGGESMTQTVSEQLSAVFRRAARPDGMLDVRQDHSTTRVRDQSTVITLAESTADRLARVLRKTDEQKLETFSSVRNNRVGYEQSRPSQRTFLERLV